MKLLDWMKRRRQWRQLAQERRKRPSLEGTVEGAIFYRETADEVDYIALLEIPPLGVALVYDEDGDYYWEG